MAGSRRPSAHFAQLPPITPKQLPDGPCHFRDIAAGRDSIPCTCRQFYLNDATANSFNAQAMVSLAVGTWCYCGHHACFHEHRGSLSPLTASNLQPEERIVQAGRTSIGAQSQDPAVVSQQHDSLSRGASLDIRSNAQRPDEEYGQRSSGLGLFASNSNNNHLDRLGSPISALQAMDKNANARLPSTQRSLDVGRLQSSPARPTVAFGSQSRPHTGSPYHHPTFPGVLATTYQAESATEMATPSLAGTPALQDADAAFASLRTNLEAFNRQHSATRLANARTSQPDPTVPAQAEQSAVVGHSQLLTASDTTNLLRQVFALRSILSSTPNLATSIGSLNSRLEAIEALSFSHLPHQEMHDKMENFDGRLLDVESKITDLEQAAAAVVAAGPRQHQLSDGPGVSFDSNASYNSGSQEGSSHMARLNAIGEQLVNHQQRLVDLEGIIPMQTNPWEVEVVFVPFGRALKGLWSPPHSIYSISGTQESATSVQHTQSAASLAVESGLKWRNMSEESLVARACGPSRGAAGRIYQRLRSRGYVRNIVLNGNSADNLTSAVVAAFLELLTLERHPKGDLSNLHGLRHPFIPLRKVHRSPALQFLSPAELTSPTLWTAEFLDASVFMHAPSSGLRRLYITNSAGYLQDQSRDLTWLQIREMPRHTAGNDHEVREADALEDCWTYDERLDQPLNDTISLSSGLSYHSSFDSHIPSPRHTNEAGSEEASDHSSSIDDTKGPSGQLPTAFHQSVMPSQPLRSVSLPSQHVPVYPRSVTPKRQVASFGNVSPLKDLPKRRRVSRSPEDVNHMGLWSPRRSREPPSPRHTRLSRRASTSRGASGKRSSTSEPQLAYATPYSADMLVGADGGLDAYTPGDSESDHDEEMQDSDVGGGADNYIPDSEDDSDVDLMQEEEDALIASAKSDLGSDDEAANHDSDDSDDSDDIDELGDGEQDWEGMDDQEDTTADVKQLGYGLHLGHEAQTWRGHDAPQEEADDEIG